MLFSFSSFSKKPNCRKCTLKCKRLIARDNWNWQNPQTSINLWVSLSSGRPSLFNNTLIACPPSDLKCKRMWNRATSILEISFVFRLQILRRKRCSFAFLHVRDFIFPDWQLPITWLSHEAECYNHNYNHNYSHKKKWSERGMFRPRTH